MSDNVNHPAHYTDGKIEVIEYIEDKGFGYCLGNAVKYISRAGKKDKAKEIEDLQKAIWYIERRIQELQVPYEKPEVLAVEKRCGNCIYVNNVMDPCNKCRNFSRWEPADHE